MVSCENLWKSVVNRDYARFWLDFSVSTPAEIDAFLENQEVTPELRRRIHHFQNLEMLPLGMAPNFKGLEELYQHFAFQDFSINIINCDDFADETDMKLHTEDAEDSKISEHFIAQQLFNIKRGISDNIINSEQSAAVQEFADLLISKLDKRLHLTLISLLKLNGYDSRILIQALICQSIQAISDYFLMLNVRESSFLALYVFRGFLFANVHGVVFLVFGLPSRAEYLEEIVFGSSTTVELHDLDCDIVIEHANGRLSEVFLDEKPGIKIELRASDTLKLLFSNDAEFRKSDNFVPLKEIRCSIEIDFSKPGKHIRSSDSERSKRMKSRSSRILKLIEQLCLVARDKIVSMDFSNVSNAVDSEILTLISGCKNLQRINLSNAGLSNSDFADCQTLPNLQVLEIDGLEIHENDFNMLTLFPNLRVLNSAGATGIIELLSKCESTPTLTQLDVSSNVLNTESEKKLPKLVFLHTFIAQNCDLSESSFDFMHKFPALQTLILRNCNFTGTALYHLSQNGKTIVNLDISVDKADMSQAGEEFQPISTMNLQFLKLSKRLITDSFFSNLSANTKNLRVLDASYTMISDVSMNYLRKMRVLEELNLTGCRNISNSGISLLCESVMNLKKLSIKGTSITEIGIAKVINRFPEIKLDFSIN